MHTCSSSSSRVNTLFNLRIGRSSLDCVKARESVACFFFRTDVI